LAVPAITVLLVTVIFALISSLLQMKHSRKKLEAKAKEGEV
jgi:hypothetical protein